MPWPRQPRCIDTAKKAPRFGKEPYSPCSPIQFLEWLSPDERDEFLGVLAMGDIARQVALQQLFLSGDAVVVGPAQQRGDHGENERAP